MAPAGRETANLITPDRKEGSSDFNARDPTLRMTAEAGRRRLEEKLGTTNPLFPFADAVVRHLTAAPAGATDGFDVAERVAGFLQHAGATSPPAVAEALLQDPEALASFFQNADLLDPDAPESRAVLRIVMEAVQLAWEDGG